LGDDGNQGKECKASANCNAAAFYNTATGLGRYFCIFMFYDSTDSSNISYISEAVYIFNGFQWCERVGDSRIKVNSIEKV
jgi:hypothetical protein